MQLLMQSDNDEIVFIFTLRLLLLVAESSMSALTMHIVRNLLHPIKSPWITVEEFEEDIIISVVKFRKNDLRGWG